MVEETDTNQDELMEPLALARLFIAGRSVKRGVLIRMVRELLALIDNPTPLVLEPSRYIETPPEDSFRITCGRPTVPLGIPNVEGYDSRPPILVQPGISGSVFLGPEANRYFTRSEAIALAGAIARTAAK